MNRFNNKSKHDQRTALPPRCSHTAMGEMTMVSGFTQEVEIKCRQPAVIIFYGSPLCRKHYAEVARDDDEDVYWS